MPAKDGLEGASCDHPAFSPNYRDTLPRATKDDLPHAGHAGHLIALHYELGERPGRERELEDLALDAAGDRAREVRTSSDREVARQVGSGLGQRQGDGDGARRSTVRWPCRLVAVWASVRVTVKEAVA